jgi:hypothetical protein
MRSWSAFPTYYNLPKEGEARLTSPYYDGADKLSRTPTKHWCFLAEIIQVVRFTRLRLTVQDRKGRAVIVAFYTPERGAEVKVKRGFTVAILYANQHEFLDLSDGVRLEDPKMIKVNPPEPRKSSFLILMAFADRSFPDRWKSC